MRRMAVIIRSVALTAEAIRSLPATPSIADSDDWLVVGSDRDTPTALEHSKAFGGRSVFLVTARFPAGPAEGRAYLKALRDAPPSTVLPAGTEWVLVRRLCLIDTLGEIQISPLVESIQLRRYGAEGQEVSKLEMQFHRRGALRRLSSADVDFQHVHFRGMGIDPFELTDPGHPAWPQFSAPLHCGRRIWQRRRPGYCDGSTPGTNGKNSNDNELREIRTRVAARAREIQALRRRS
jgi:hypothetical protein